MRHLSDLVSLSVLLLAAGAGCSRAQAAAAEPLGEADAPLCAADVGTATGPRLDPSTRAFVDALAARGLPPLYTLPAADARNALKHLQQAYAPASAIPADIQDEVLPVGPHGSVPIRIVRPQGAAATLPVVMYFHGGGWILGDETTHDRLIRALANFAEAAVVFVKYTPSPEAQYPVPLQEAYAATRYIAENGAHYGLDGTHLAVAGDSVGGNMATLVAILAKQRGGPTIRLQALAYPVTDACFDDASYQQFAEGPWLTRKTMQWFFDAYAPDAATRELPSISPLRASLTDLSGLPPALVITGENDVLRDQGEAYAHRLMDAGVYVQSARYLGAIHDFLMLNALADTGASRSATALMGLTLHDVLSR